MCRGAVPPCRGRERKPYGGCRRAGRLGTEAAGGGRCRRRGRAWQGKGFRVLRGLMELCRPCPPCRWCAPSCLVWAAACRRRLAPRCSRRCRRRCPRWGGLVLLSYFSLSGFLLGFFYVSSFVLLIYGTLVEARSCTSTAGMRSLPCSVLRPCGLPHAALRWAGLRCRGGELLWGWAGSQSGPAVVPVPLVKTWSNRGASLCTPCPHAGGVWCGQGAAGEAADCLSAGLARQAAAGGVQVRGDRERGAGVAPGLRGCREEALHCRRQRAGLV